MRKQWLILVFIFCSVTFVVAQQINLPLNNEINNAYLSSTEKVGNNFHSSVKPYLASELNALHPSSVYSSDSTNYWQNAYRFFTLQSATKPESAILVFPILNSGFTFVSDSSQSILQYGGGAGISAYWKDKLGFEAEITTINAQFPDYLENYILSHQTLPGTNYAHPTKEGYSITQGSFALSFSPHRFFTIQTGFGKHFWGDGYRSLLLSDNAYNYPYLKLSTNFWHVKYTNLFAMMQDIRFSNGNPNDFVRKYVSMHYLDWNITKRFTLGVYESIVWQAKDTLLNRQFDINYLNPFVFYRPVEYALGSSDNALLGLNAKLKITDNYQLYGQAILDEFLLKEIMGDSTGWWANKFGFQVGAKAIDPFGITNLQLQLEFNWVRPFTYSHGSIKQNYAHYNSPLAHPLGANFKEWNGFIRYTIKSFQIEEQITTSVFGTDSSNASFGGNVYQSYANRYQDYHNKVGQGLRNNFFYHQLKLSWVIMPRINLRLFASHTYRKLSNSLTNQANNYFQVGISTNLGNFYYDH